MNGNILSLNSLDVGRFNGIYSLEILKNELKRELKDELSNDKSSSNLRNEKNVKMNKLKSRIYYIILILYFIYVIIM